MDDLSKFKLNVFKFQMDDLIVQIFSYWLFSNLTKLNVFKFQMVDLSKFDIDLNPYHQKIETKLKENACYQPGLKNHTDRVFLSNACEPLDQGCVSFEGL